MKLQSTLSILVGVIMIVGFLAQMWDLFDKFLGQSKTVAVSFEERGALEFPSFAFCDSRAFRNNTLVEQLGNEVFFNATTFDLVKDVEVGDSWSMGTEINYSVHIVATHLNGYCKVFDIHGSYPPSYTYIGNMTTHNAGNRIGSYIFLFRVSFANKQII